MPVLVSQQRPAAPLNFGCTPDTRLQYNQFFFAMVSHSDQHQGALALTITSDIEVDSISPDVNIVLVFQIRLAPLLILFNPGRL